MPAYTIGKQKRQNKLVNDSPGVGCYSPKKHFSSKLKTSPTVSIGRATRNTFKESISPGPATYDIKSSSISLEKGISLKGKSKQKFNPETPSPANYDGAKKFSSTYYSFGKAAKTQQVRQGPSPQTYFCLTPKTQSKVSFGKQKRDGIVLNRSPGPGSYQIRTQHSQSPKISFPRQSKFKQNQTILCSKKKLPGPGAYELEYLKKGIQAVKFGREQRSGQSTQKNLVPGVGSYNVRRKLSQSPATIIGKSPRGQKREEDTPGPGAYKVVSISTYKQKKSSIVYVIFQLSFPLQSRLTSKNSTSPGPGAYETGFSSKKSAFTIPRGSLWDKKELSPSPQDYSPSCQSVYKSPPKAIIGSQPRLKEQKSDTPGPGKYNYKYPNNSKSYLFNKSRPNNDTPFQVGPGHYKLKPYIGLYDGYEKTSKQILYV